MSMDDEAIECEVREEEDGHTRYSGGTDNEKERYYERTEESHLSNERPALEDEEMGRRVFIPPVYV